MYLFWPPVSPSTSEMLTNFGKCAPGDFLVGRTFCSKYGYEFGLMADDDDFCVRLGESARRLQMDTVLAG